MKSLRAKLVYRNSWNYTPGDRSEPLVYLCLGIFCNQHFLYTIARISGKMGGGDVKLMAVAGLLLGWKLNVLGFLLGCILAV